MNQIIGSDFITFYGSGIAYRTDISHLYNLDNQYQIQQGLIEPTKLSGVDPFINPPYVAQTYSLFTFFPLTSSFIIWSILSLFFSILAVYLGRSLLPQSIKSNISFGQLLIIVLSFFPFIEGFQVGQNHTLTLLLVIALIVVMVSEHWFTAGIIAGMMVYKPQLVIGILIIWVVWRKYKAIGGFTLSSMTWAGSFILIHGIEPFKAYFTLSKDLLLLPYMQGFPGYLLTTLYGLLATIFSIRAHTYILPLTTVFAVVALIGLGWVAFMYRNLSLLDSTPAIVLAILIPLFISPHFLLHDFLVIIPLFLLWARYSYSRNLLNVAIAVYLLGFFLTFLSVLTKIALLAFVPLGLIALIILHIIQSRKPILLGETS